MKKKKGSSLIMVIMIFSIFMIFGVSILSLTLSSYGKRIVESKEKRNQYFSESGLDIAYGIMGDILDKAIKDGEEAVKVYMEKELIEDESVNDENGNIDETKLRQKQDLIFKDTYKKYVIKKIDKNQENCIEEGLKDEENPNLRKSNYKIDGDNGPKVTLLNASEDLKFKTIKIKSQNEETLQLKLESNFIKDKINKKIGANYNIKVPSYNDAYYLETTKVEIPKVVCKNSLYIDGNFYVLGNVNINGDIYIKGNEREESGINIKSQKSVISFNGDVATGGDFKITNHSNKVNVSNNIYAGNMTIDKRAVSSEFNVKQNVYLNNDLELNGEKSNVNIQGSFYGIGNVKYLNENMKGNIKGKKKPKTSSCILINADDIGKGSSITIAKDSLIMGTAYIQTKDISYQTGESTAIKGNYRAYSYPLKYNSESDTVAKRISGGKQSLAEDNIIFDYIDPLTLINSYKDGKQLKWQDKSDYFKIYSEEYSSDKDLNLGVNGLNFLSSVSHIGAIVSKGEVFTGNYDLDKEDRVLEKTKEYEEKIFNETSTNKFLKSTGDIVNFDNIKNTENLNDDQNIIYLNKTNEPCALLGYNGKISSGINRYISLNSGSGKGIIVSSGDVYICGDVKFAGTIITKGNIIMESGSNLNLENDTEYLKKLIACNYDKFTDIFIAKDKTYKDIITVELKADKIDIGTDIVRDKLITMEQWRILK